MQILAKGEEGKGEDLHKYNFIFLVGGGHTKNDHPPPHPPLPPTHPTTHHKIKCLNPPSLDKHHHQSCSLPYPQKPDLKSTRTALKLTCSWCSIQEQSERMHRSSPHRQRRKENNVGLNEGRKQSNYKWITNCTDPLMPLCQCFLHSLYNLPKPHQVHDS